MTWRDELETLVVLLRLSAVDAYMRNRGSMKEEWNNRGDFYVEDRTSLPAAGRSKLCARPNGQGYGGGELYEQPSERIIGSDRYVVKFEEIQSRIDRIMEPWYHLPDPVLIAEAATAYGGVLEDLSLGVNERITGRGSLVPNMTRIWDELIGHDGEGHYMPALAGGAIDAFKEYVKNLDCAIGGCAGIARSLAEYVTAQQKLWKSVSQNVASLVSQVIAACVAVANSEGHGTGIGLEETGLVLGIASAAPGPVGKAATAAGVVLTLGAAIDKSDVRQDVKIDSCDSAIDALDKLLNTSFYSLSVNEMIRTFERSTREAVTTSIREVDLQRDLFDLVPHIIDSVDGVIRYDKRKADNIVERLDSIGVELGNTASLISNCVAGLQPPLGPQIRRSSVLERDYSIGVGRTGPSDEIIALTDLLNMLLVELSEEVSAGAENLRSAMAALDGFNSQGAASLAAAAETYALSDRGGIDSFDFHPWTPVGQAEVRRRSRLDDVLGLSSGSSNGAGAADAAPQANAAMIDWSLMGGRALDDVFSSTAQSWCAMDPDDRLDDGEVVIRQQPEKPR